jgi:hypothetical protein
MQCTLLSAACETLSNIDHILGYKVCLNKFKNIEITSCFISDHNGINRAQQQRKPQKIFKHMETEQHTAE